MCSSRKYEVRGTKTGERIFDGHGREVHNPVLMLGDERRGSGVCVITLDEASKMEQLLRHSITDCRDPKRLAAPYDIVCLA